MGVKNLRTEGEFKSLKMEGLKIFGLGGLLFFFCFFLGCVGGNFLWGGQYPITYYATMSTSPHPPNVWERLVDDVYSIFKRSYLENFFHHINNLHQNIKFTIEEESNGELAFLDTWLKWNNEKISVFVYRKPTHADHHLYRSHHQTSSKDSFVSSLFNRAYPIIANKDD